jgi:hypothetical protein
MRSGNRIELVLPACPEIHLIDIRPEIEPMFGFGQHEEGVADVRSQCDMAIHFGVYSSVITRDGIYGEDVYRNVIAIGLE